MSSLCDKHHVALDTAGQCWMCNLSTRVDQPNDKPDCSTCAMQGSGCGEGERCNDYVHLEQFLKDNPDCAEQPKASEFTKNVRLNIPNWHKVLADSEDCRIRTATAWLYEACTQLDQLRALKCPPISDGDVCICLIEDLETKLVAKDEEIGRLKAEIEKGETHIDALFRQADVLKGKP